MSGEGESASGAYLKAASCAAVSSALPKSKPDVTSSMLGTMPPTAEATCTDGSVSLESLQESGKVRRRVQRVGYRVGRVCCARLDAGPQDQPKLRLDQPELSE